MTGASSDDRSDQAPINRPTANNRNRNRTEGQLPHAGMQQRPSGEATDNHAADAEGDPGNRQCGGQGGVAEKVGSGSAP